MCEPLMEKRRTNWLCSAVWAVLLATSWTTMMGQIPQSAWVEVDDSTQIYYLDAGPHNEAPAMILIPGWRFAAGIWKAQINHFSSARRVLAIDPRSQGDSTKTSEGNTLEVRAQDLQHLILHLKLSKVVLVGWSQGVQDIAAYVDHFGGDKIAGLVFVDAAVSAGTKEVQLNPRLSEQILDMAGSLATDPKKFSQEFVPQMFKRPHDATFLQGLVTDSLKTPTSTAIAMLVTATFTVDRRPVLAKITRPTLIVCASNCGHPHIANSEVVLMEGVGHALFADDPARFNAIVDEFIKRHEH